MAKPLAPLFSFIAKGTIGKLITFDRYAKTNIARIIPTHKDAKTAAQQLQRTKFQEAAEEWYLMTPAEKAAYETEGTKHHMTGYAWFMRAFLLNPAPRTFLELEDTPDSYVAQALKYLRVNAAEDALEFAAAGGAADYPLDLYVNTEMWRVPGWAVHSTSGQIVISGRLYYIPIFITATYSYDKMDTEVTVAVADKKARLGLYYWSNGAPGNLILDAGQVDVSSIGNKELDIDLTLTRGYYFLAWVSDGAPTIRSFIATGVQKTPVAAFGVIGDLIPQQLILAKANVPEYVDAGLPDPADEPTTYAKGVYGGLIKLREVHL